MATTEVEPGQILAHEDDVASCAPAERWVVEEQAWAELAPALSAETIELLAPSVTVCASLRGTDAA